MAGVRSHSIVATKLQVPELPPSYLHRPRLYRSLDAATDRQLTIVVAPAGFGKTVSVSAWARRRETAEQIAWLTLGPDDGEPLRFWTGLVEGIRCAAPDTLSDTHRSLAHGVSPIGDSFASKLINDLCGIRERVTVIIDNFEHVTHPALRDWAGYTMRSAPPNIRFVLLSRTEPQLPMSRWRAEGRLSEIGADELRFTDGEAEAYLDPLIAGELDREQLDIILRSADGWIAGLYLAALGVLRAPDATSFIEEFGRAGDPVSDFVVHDVLEGLPRSMRSFLLKTSLLTDLSPAACDALLERTDSSAMLDALQRHGVFVTAPQGSVTAYHPLFRKVLRSLLERTTDREELAAMHVRIAHASIGHGEFTHALRHAIAAEDFDLACEILATEADNMLQSAPEALLDLLSRLPQNRLDALPRLRKLQIWTAAVLADADAMQRLWARESLIEGHHEPLARALLHYLRADLISLEAWLSGGDGLLGPRAQAAARALVATVREDYEPGAALLLESFSGSENPLVSLATISLLAWNRVRAGKLNLGAAYAAQALDIAGETGLRWFHGVRWAELAQAHVEFDRGRLEAAYMHVLPVTEASNIDAVTRSEAHVLAARIAWALGHREAAARFLGAATTGPAGPVAGPVALRASGTQALLCLQDRDPQLAEAWVPDWRSRVDDDTKGEFETLLIARLLVANDRPTEALALADRYAANDTRSVRFLIEAQKLRAIAMQAMSEPAAAMQFEIAIAMAEPEGFVQTFLDDGAVLGAIRRPGDAGIHASLGPVHRNFAIERAAPLERCRTVPIDLIDPLTDRELAVLHYLPTRLSNHEIANHLFVSINTVKTHMRAIYRKLGVNCRNDAVDRAVALRLV